MLPENSSIDRLLPWLRLAQTPGIPLRRQHELLSAFGTPDALQRTHPAELRERCGDAIADCLQSGPHARAMAATMRWLESPAHRVVTLADAEYPQRLLQISDPPLVLYAVGRVELLNAPAIAMVGSRNASPQGSKDAEAFAEALSSAGLCVVSGMALGIDAAAHRGALRAAGSSVAVLGTGPEAIYPRRNRALAQALAEGGCLVTEFAPGTPLAAANFPRRNRLISGMSLGVWVIEASPGSGSLITARFALEQNRDVFAMPGSIHSPLSKGCHHLIRSGARLAEKAQDVIEELGWKGMMLSVPAESGPVAADPVLDALGFDPLSIDQVAERCGMDVPALCARMSALELEGRVVSLPGGRLQRVARGP